MRNFLLLSIGWLISTTILAQPTFVATIQQDIQQAENYHVVSLDTNGLILFFKQTQKVNKKLYDWNFYHYDTALNQTHHLTITSKENFEYKNLYANSGKYFYVLLGNKQTYSYRLIIWDLAQKQMQTMLVELPIGIDVMLLEVVNNDIYIGGYANEKPIITHTNLSTQTTHIIPALYDDEGEIVFMSKDETKNLFHIVLAKFKAYQCKLYHKSYKQEGLLNEVKEIGEKQQKPEHYLTNARTHSKIAPTWIGTYSHSQTEFAQGLFIQKNDSTAIDYIPFVMMPHFFDFLPEKRRKKHQTKQRKDYEKRQKTHLKYRWFLQEAEFLPDSTLLLTAETYDLQYKMTTNDPYLSQIPSYTVAAYQPIFAFTCVFDKNVNIIQHKSFKLKTLPVKDFLQPSTSIFYEKNKKWIAAYNDQEKLYTYNLQNDTEQEINLKEWTKTTWKDPKTMKWYAKNLLLYGKINDKKKRNIIQINKIIIQDSELKIKN